MVRRSYLAPGMFSGDSSLSMIEWWLCALRAIRDLMLTAELSRARSRF